MADTKPATIEQIAKLLKELMPPIVRNETNDIRSELSRHTVELKSIRTDVRQLKESVRHQGVLLEELDDRFVALAEVVDENLSVKSKVDDHEERLGEVESMQSIMKRTLRAHSKQLKNKPV